MNNEYVYTKDYIIVGTDNGLEKRKNTSNILDILEVENNIEEIVELKVDVSDEHAKERSNLIEKIYVKNHLLSSGSITVIITILMSIIYNIPTAMVLLPTVFLSASVVYCLCSPLLIKKASKLQNSIKAKQQEILENELENETQKLKQLNKESKVVIEKDLTKMNNIFEIERTELIDDLKRKLELIKDYQLNKEEYIEYSKDHFISIKLRNKGYSENDINFIQTLIKEDLKLEKDNKKQKTLKLKKNKI